MPHGGSGQVTDLGREVPAAVVARLPELLRILAGAADRGDFTISSDDLARSLDVSGAMVRKDLSFLGFAGTRGVGYDVAALRYQITSVLGLTADRPVVIVGAGHLGQALAAYPGFADQGFRIAAVFDHDTAVIGAAVGPVEVQSSADIESVVQRLDARMAIIAVPASAAQHIADRLVASGVVSLLNFAPVPLVVPDHVQVRRTDLAAELQILAFHVRTQPAGAIS